MIVFSIKLADVVFIIKANYQETKAYFLDFLCEQPPQETIIIMPDDIRELQKKAPHFTPQMCERGVLKVMLDKRLVAYGAFALHASAIEYRGKGLVFTALSGVGKSTHSASWKRCFPEDVVIINDDRPYIRIIGSEAWIYSHPQSGKDHIYTNTSCPITAFCRIVRDSQNDIEPIKKADFFPFLVQQTFTLDDPALTARIIGLHRKALECASVFVVHCTAEPEAAMTICSRFSDVIEGWNEGKTHG